MESRNGDRQRPGRSDSLSSEDVQVMSEIHLGCPPGYSGLHTSQFFISLPSTKGINQDESALSAEACGVDEDGDLILTRRSKASKCGFMVKIRHNITSSIPRVGLQVWRAELVLADFMLHKMFTSSEIDGVVALELGADHGKEVLDNCAENISINVGIRDHNASVYVRELDWNCSLQPQAVEDSQSDFEERRYNWTSSEVEQCQNTTLIVAADVIYSDDLTDAFFSTLERIMSVGSEKVLYLALEKRYNFSLDDLDVVANGYSHFRSYLRVTDCDEHESISRPKFLGKPVDLTEIPQYVMEYERGTDVELWQIKYDKMGNLLE